MLYVVELVARMHHAVVYEMKTAAAPENAMAKSRNPRPSAGLTCQSVSGSLTTHKFWLRLSADQSSSSSEKMTSTGTLRALLRKRTSTSCFVSHGLTDQPRTLKLVTLIRLRMPSTYPAETRTLRNIQT